MLLLAMPAMCTQRELEIRLEEQKEANKTLKSQVQLARSVRSIECLALSRFALSSPLSAR
jgi:hypothetical protein